MDLYFIHSCCMELECSVDFRTVVNDVAVEIKVNVAGSLSVIIDINEVGFRLVECLYIYTHRGTVYRMIRIIVSLTYF